MTKRIHESVETAKLKKVVAERVAFLDKAVSKLHGALKDNMEFVAAMQEDIEDVYRDLEIAVEQDFEDVDVLNAQIQRKLKNPRAARARARANALSRVVKQAEELEKDFVEAAEAGKHVQEYLEDMQDLLVDSKKRFDKLTGKMEELV